MVLFFAIGALLFWLAVKDQNIHLIREKLARADWVWAVPALALSCISNIVRAARWNLLIHPLGDRPRLVNTFGAVVVGYMANLALPRAGEVSRCVVLNRYEKTPIDKLFGTVVTERAIDVLTVVLLLGVVVLLESDKMGAFSVRYVLRPLEARVNVGVAQRVSWFAIIAAVCVAAFGLYGALSVSDRDSGPASRLRTIMSGFTSGIRTIGQLHNEQGFVLYTILLWALYVVAAYACFQSFRATSGLGLIAALAVVVFGGLGWAAPVQGGIGTVDIMITQTLVMFGTPVNDGLAYAILWHATQVIGMVVFGVCAVVLLPIINRRPPVRKPNPMGSV